MRNHTIGKYTTESKVEQCHREVFNYLISSWRVITDITLQDTVNSCKLYSSDPR